MHLNVFPSLGSRFFTSCCRPLHKVWHDHTKKSGSDNEQNLICCSSSTISILAPLGAVTLQKITACLLWRYLKLSNHLLDWVVYGLFKPLSIGRSEADIAHLCSDHFRVKAKTVSLLYDVKVLVFFSLAEVFTAVTEQDTGLERTYSFVVKYWCM